MDHMSILKPNPNNSLICSLLIRSSSYWMCRIKLPDILSLTFNLMLAFKINVFDLIEIVDVNVELVVHGDVIHQIGSDKS